MPRQRVQRWLRRGSLTLAVAALVYCAGTCNAPRVAPKEHFLRSPWFEDVTAAVGIDFVQDPGPFGSYYLPQIQGTGAALFDFDRDGRLDILLLQGAGPKSTATNRLYRQLPNGTFRDISKGSGLDFAGYN